MLNELLTITLLSIYLADLIVSFNLICISFFLAGYIFNLQLFLNNHYSNTLLEFMGAVSDCSFIFYIAFLLLVCSVFFAVFTTFLILLFFLKEFYGAPMKFPAPEFKK